MRVASFNILHGASVADGYVDLAVLAASVTSLDADVVALQEVDRNQTRSGGADLAAVAAEAMRAVDHRFVATMVGRAEHRWVAADGSEADDVPAYGIATLSRHPVTAWKVLRLPTFRAPAPHRPRGERRPTLVREELRVALAAVLETAQGPRTVVNTHLSFVPWLNGRQLRTVADALPVLPQPALLVGDLNMGAARVRRLTGLTPLVEAPTFPASDPREQLDHVLGRDPVPAATGEARLLPVSDHCALVADVEL
jgi:endonuclease/exonuclease/phosphatase family metal-dependent hydrolase